VWHGLTTIAIVVALAVAGRRVFKWRSPLLAEQT